MQIQTGGMRAMVLRIPRDAVQLGWASANGGRGRDWDRAGKMLQ